MKEQEEYTPGKYWHRVQEHCQWALNTYSQYEWPTRVLEGIHLEVKISEIFGEKINKISEIENDVIMEQKVVNVLMVKRKILYILEYLITKGGKKSSILKKEMK